MPAATPPERGPAWVTVMRFGSPIQADMMAEILQNEGIPARVRDRHTLSIYSFFHLPIFGFIRLDVPTTDERRARELLEVWLSATDLFGDGWGVVG